MIYYLCYYGNTERGFNVSPAAQAVEQYTAATMSNIQNVVIASPARNISGNDKIEEKINDGLLYINAPNSRATNILTQKAGTLRTLLWIYRYLRARLKTDDTLLVYHSLPLMSIARRLKAKTKCKLIIGIHEIYGDVNGDEACIKKELEWFGSADSYIFATELLESKINKEHKPYAIIYGAYSVSGGERSEKFNDGRIHCVYAGTFDRTKGGAHLAVRAARYLSKDYCLHILGFGSDAQIAELKAEIAETQRNTDCQITYEGLLQGSAYDEFLKKCHIGLSSQRADLAYCDTSFPSKILTYLSNGLRVVSARLPVLSDSKIAHCITMYCGNDPEDIARAISGIDTNAPFDGVRVVGDLHRELIDRLAELLQN